MINVIFAYSLDLQLPLQTLLISFFIQLTSILSISLPFYLFLLNVKLPFEQKGKKNVEYTIQPYQR